MRSRYLAALDGVELSAIAPEIIVTDITHNAPIRENRSSNIAGRNGKLYTRTVTSSAGVTVSFEIHTQDVRRRAAIMEDVQRWAMPGGVLTTSDRPDRVLRVVCESLPTIGSAQKWTGVCSIGFVAYAVPFWEDETPRRVSITGNGRKSLFVPGFAAPAGVEAKVTNTGSGTISSVTLTAGETSMTFNGLSLGAGQTMTIAHDARGLLTARIGGTSVLGKRTAASSDELELEPGKNAALSVTTNGTASTTFEVRGRYA